MNIVLFNTLASVAMAGIGSSLAMIIRGNIKAMAERNAHVSWTVRYDYIGEKYGRSDYWAPEYAVTLRKRSDAAIRPSWLYDGDNRRMLRADEIKGL